jgi:hypothetical protein
MPLILRPTGLASPFDRDRIDYLVIDDGREVGRIYEDRYVPAAAQVSAAIALLDRAWGKPHQALEVGINRASFDEMSDDELLDREWRGWRSEAHHVDQLSRVRDSRAEYGILESSPELLVRSRRSWAVGLPARLK